MKSKNIKIPMELVESLEKRNTGRPPGESLHEIYREYELIESFTSSIKANRKDLQKASVYDIIIDRDNRINELQTQINELQTMFKGLQIFFTKVKK
jgi:hypothetical protein